MFQFTRVSPYVVRPYLVTRISGVFFGRLFISRKNRNNIHVKNILLDRGQDNTELENSLFGNKRRLF